MRAPIRTDGGRERDLMKKPIGGAFQGEYTSGRRLGSMQRIDQSMRRYSETEIVDFLVVGVGAAGGVLLQRLARGMSRQLYGRRRHNDA